MTRELCFQFAYQLYLNSEDGESELKNMWSVGEELGISRAQIQQVAESLKSEGLLEYLSFAGDAVLTNFGTAAVMQALADKDQATVYFPPVASLLPQVDDVDETITSKSVNDFIDDIASSAEKMLLDEQERVELEAGLVSLERYIDSGAVNKLELRNGLERVCAILSGDEVE